MTWILYSSISAACPTYFSSWLFKSSLTTSLESDSSVVTVRLTVENRETHVLLTSVGRSTMCCG